MVNQPLILRQTLFRASHDPIVVVQVNESEVTESVVETFLQTVKNGVLGVASAYGPKGVLVAIVFSTSSHVLYVRMSKPKGRSKSKSKGRSSAPQGREILRRAILCKPAYRKLALDMHRIATALHMDHGLPIAQAIDLQSMFVDGRRHSTQTLLKVLGGEAQIRKEQVLDTFCGDAFDAASVENVSLRAWASCQVGFIAPLQLLAVPAIDTQKIDSKLLSLLSKFVRDADRLHALKPTKVKNDVAADFSQKSGALHVHLTRFKTRMRTSATQTVLVEIETNGRPVIRASGRTVRAEGKSARVSVNQAVSASSKIRSVYTIGREDPTQAQAERTTIILSILQRRSDLPPQRLFRNIFVASSPTKRKKKRTTTSQRIYFPARPLNDSQTAAVNRILSEDDEDQICLINGPPGTGKTTVIAACVSSIRADPQTKCGIWILAHSNVAVKNIAEKLADVGFFDYKILVSHDFHFEWHEHLYEKIERNVITSEEFAEDDVGTERLLLGSQVILCTLSMISNQRLGLSGFTRLVPVNTVIVDEASQIELGDYVPLLGRFGGTIRKLAFIGDGKQLAPYGQDDLGDLPSIFELDHLQQRAVFLDTQYRMPGPIGSFISRHVYGGRLKTSHDINTRLSCRLFDIRHGKEQKSGNSWVNLAEADAAVLIAKKLHAQDKSFRIITPYDGQRNMLERRLKAANVPWENRCFNVDSFQGNEEDYIIISVVRSEKVGFLANLRRTNVMLSRCKRSMLICTSRAFLEQKASSSLVGKLGAEWGEESWLTWKDLLAGKL